MEKKKDKLKMEADLLMEVINNIDLMPRAKKAMDKEEGSEMDSEESEEGEPSVIKLLAIGKKKKEEEDE